MLCCIISVKKFYGTLLLTWYNWEHTNIFVLIFKCVFFQIFQYIFLNYQLYWNPLWQQLLWQTVALGDCIVWQLRTYFSNTDHFPNVQIDEYICPNAMIWYHTSVVATVLSKLSDLFIQMLNIFVLITQYICPNCYIYSFRLTNVFVQIAEYICPIH